MIKSWFHNLPWPRWATPRGLTLMEVVMTMSVFAIAILALFGVYGTLASTREIGRNLNQAMADAQTVLERMRESSGSGLSSVTGTDWGTWAQQNNLTRLSGEAVTVTYADTNADPLDVTVRVAWMEQGRTRSAELQSAITQR